MTGKGVIRQEELLEHVGDLKWNGLYVVHKGDLVFVVGAHASEEIRARKGWQEEVLVWKTARVHLK